MSDRELLTPVAETINCEVCGTPGAEYLYPTSTLPGYHTWKCVLGCMVKFTSDQDHR